MFIIDNNHTKKRVNGLDQKWVAGQQIPCRWTSCLYIERHSSPFNGVITVFWVSAFQVIMFLVIVIL